MSRVVKDLFLLSELTYSEKGLEYKAKNGFEVLNQRFETVCEQSGSRVEHYCKSSGQLEYDPI